MLADEPLRLLSDGGAPQLCSGAEAVRKFERAGWTVARQRGSHVIMVKPGYEYTLSVPQHSELGPGLLRSSSVKLISPSKSLTASSLHHAQSISCLCCQRDVSEKAALPCRPSAFCLSERPFQARPSGILLEFPQPRSFDSGASVGFCFPSRRCLAGLGQGRRWPAGVLGQATTPSQCVVAGSKLTGGETGC